MDERLKLEMDPYHRPSFCSKCGGVMVFGGVGEYHCEDCKNIEYDDFGKVRLFIEQNRGATAVQIEESTGVKQKTIRQMLRENRLEITTGIVKYVEQIFGQDVSVIAVKRHIMST